MIPTVIGVILLTFILFNIVQRFSSDLEKMLLLKCSRDLITIED